jgi:hypothetical protein
MAMTKKRPKPEADPGPEKEQPVRLYLPARVHRELRVEAAKAGVPMAILVRKWVMEKLGHLPGGAGGSTTS